MLALEHLVDLRCSPCRFLAFQLQNRRLNSRRYLTREPSGPARKIIKSLRPVLFVALLKFVAGLARDSKFPAQIRHPFARLQASHKLHSFVHCGNLFPGHGPSSTPLKVLPMSPVIFVTYVSGLHQRHKNYNLLVPYVLLVVPSHVTSLEFPKHFSVLIPTPPVPRCASQHNAARRNHLEESCGIRSLRQLSAARSSSSVWRV